LHGETTPFLVEQFQTAGAVKSQLGSTLLQSLDWMAMRKQRGIFCCQLRDALKYKRMKIKLA